MRLHSLVVEGFGPFRARQRVDFDGFADDGIFLIAGRTGAGKSSILDAVCFALYGGVPRYDSGEKRLRSDHSEPDEPTSVSVEFSTVAGRFRVTRSPAYERPAKRGGGMTTQAPSALLERFTDEGWVGVAARVVDVAGELADILQLSQEQFLQVILLAQNRFADFLLADSRERQKLLRRLFGTERFEDIQLRFDDRRRAAQEALSGRLARIDARLEEAERMMADAGFLDGTDTTPDNPLATADRVGAIQRAVAQADYRSEQRGIERDQASQRLVTADEALAEAREQRQAQAERDRVRAELKELDGLAPEIAVLAVRRDRARAANVLRSTMAAVAKAERAALSAHDARLAAVTCLRDEPATWNLGGSTPTTSGSAETTARLRAWAAERTQAIGSWRRAADLEQSNTERKRDLEAARQAVADATARADEIEQERLGLPGEIDIVTKKRDAERARAARSDDLARAVDVATDKQVAAAEVARLAEQLTLAERTLLEHTTAHKRAQDTLVRLRESRLDGFAGELAAALVPGDACAVCGSTDHPAPAQHSDPVSADDVAAAEQVRDAAAAQEKAATEDRTAIQVALAAAESRSGGLSAAQAEQAVAHAQEELTAAREAAHAAKAAETALAELYERRQHVEERRETAARETIDARERLARADAEYAAAEEAVVTARGDYPSVAARLQAALTAVAAATAAADAIDDDDQRRGELDDARAALAGALEDSPFASSAEAAEAVLLPEQIDDLDERCTSHAVQRDKAKAILLPLELRALPEEAIDLEPPIRAAAEARAEWVAAVEAASRADGVRDGLRGAAESAASEHRAAADEADAYDTVRALADALAGRSGNTHRMNLETFVLAAELEEIVAAANLRLADMSGGRYRLQHSDALSARGAASGLGIDVFDAFTGQTRPARSLSGGETFLSSLALALGLAEVVTARAGGIHLDTLFIDEGFGSLDGDTLDTAMRTLDELRQGGRTVGIISHVEAMQEQIPAQLTVRSLPDGSSMIERPGVSGR